MEDFMNVIIPLFLSELDTEYYVKGGKAYDFYFREKSNSIDWDIVMTKKTYEILVEKLRSFGTKNGMVLKEISRQNFGMIQLSLQKGDEIFYYDDSKDPYFMDCVIEEEIKENPVIWNKIRYMNMTHFVKDLIETLSNRYEIVRNKTKKFFASKKQLASIVKNINSLKDAKLYVMSHLNSLEDIYVKDKLRDFLVKYQPPEKLHNLGEIISDMMVDFNRVDTDIDDHYDSIGKERNDNDKENLEKLNIDMSDISAFYLLQKESAMIRYKYHKTYNRAQNVAEISWDKLSDEYKRYLLENCSGTELNIFAVGTACKAYIECKSKNVVKNTSGCFSDKEKHSVLYHEIN